MDNTKKTEFSKYIKNYKDLAPISFSLWDKNKKIKTDLKNIVNYHDMIY